MQGNNYERGYMSFEGFCIYMKNALQQRLWGECEVALQSVTKTNNIDRKALAIRSQNSNVSPAIYLEDFYEAYVSGIGLAELEEEIFQIYETYKPTMNFDARQIIVWENVKQKIMYKIINRDANRELLEQVPHIFYLDLAIVFYIQIDSDSHATALIYNGHMDYWNVTVEELYKTAHENTQKALPYDLQNVDVYVKGTLGTPSDMEADMEYESYLYFLTNRSKEFGAAVILYDHILECFADSVKSDVYILPSSVHEVIVISVRRSVNPQQLAEMVKEVNSTIREDEFLSDHVYLYSRLTGKITIAG